MPCLITQVTREVFEASKGRLKVVGRAGVGIDNVDLVAATEVSVMAPWPEQQKAWLVISRVRKIILYFGTCTLYNIIYNIILYNAPQNSRISLRVGMEGFLHPRN